MRVSVGDRLKEERKRIGLRQEDLAQACDVARRSQILFEKDQHLPGGAYLIAADALGMDVRYVLTGRRGILPPDEMQLVEAWRQAGQAARNSVAATLSVQAMSNNAPAPRTQFVNASIGQVNNADAVDLRGQKIVVKGPGKKSKTVD